LRLVVDQPESSSSLQVCTITSFLISVVLTSFHLVGYPLSDVACTNELIIEDAGVMFEWFEAVLAKFKAQVQERLIESAFDSIDRHLLDKREILLGH